MFGPHDDDTGPTPVLRLTIVQQGDDLVVASSQAVRMRLPPSDPTYGLEGQAGFWIEVRSDQRECVYRRILPSPFTDEVEAPSGDPERPFTRVPVPSRERVFVLLVPDTEAARDLVLCASPEEGRAGEAREVAAIDLRKPTGKVRKLREWKEPRGERKKKDRGSKKGSSSRKKGRE